MLLSRKIEPDFWESRMANTKAYFGLIVAIWACVSFATDAAAQKVSVSFDGFPLKAACETLTNLGMKPGKKNYSVSCDESLSNAKVSVHGEAELVDLLNDLAKQVGAEIETGYNAGADTYNLKGAQPAASPAPTN